MKISILTPDISHNCLGRAYILAKMLKPYYQVEIIGPLFGKNIWGPLANNQDIPYKYLKINNRTDAYRKIKKLISLISGDIIYASKPLFTSFGIGAIKKFKEKIPLILDIDDWQRGFITEDFRNLPAIYRIKRLIYSTLFPYEIDSYWNNLIGESFVNITDGITVSNNFLKNRFGGKIIWHAKDTKTFNPNKFNKAQMRSKYRIDKNKKVVLYLGTIRPHKGIESVIDAVGIISDKDIMFIIVGTEQWKYAKNLIKKAQNKLGERFKAFGIQPFSLIPEFLSISDIVVVPLKKTKATISQIPAKVFDAMAMAKPIIASNVGDLPYILKGCGWIVEPDNPERFAQTIQYIFNHPSEAKAKGEKARKKCEQEYSWTVMGKKLLKIFEKYRR